MGQFGLPAIALASGALAAGMQYRSGKIQQIQYKQEAKQEGDQARQREIERKRNLLRALASQRASAAAAGAEFSGSLLNAARVDIEEAATDLSVDQVNAARRQRALRLAGTESSRAGIAAAGGSLLDSGYKAYEKLG
jgi:hypothetical protein